MKTLDNPNVLAAPRRLSLPKGARRLGLQLMAQQCWCWGQDCKCHSGNLLVERGFERMPPPSGEGGATTYWRQESQCCIGLWGFGLYFGRPDGTGIFLGRFDFAPRLMSAPPTLPIWSPVPLQEASRLPQNRAERLEARQLLSESLQWIADYERWVTTRRGLDYRQKCLENWPQKALDASQIADLWTNLSAQCRFARLHRI